jgi:hypothetical protein
MSQRFLAYILLMFISPAFSLYQMLKVRSRAMQKWGLVTFITFFGSVIYLRESSDGYVHQERVYLHYTQLGFGQFWQELLEILLLVKNPDTNDDVYIHVLSWITGTVLGAPQLFFVFVAFIYGYFYAGSLFRIFEVFPDYRRNKLFFGLGLVFLFWVWIDGMSTVRTWTGMWILFYACISYYQSKKFKYILLMFVPPFIHIGYLAMAMPAWTVLLLGNRRMLFSAIFFLSFISTILNPDTINRQLSQTELGESKVKGYYVEEQITSEQILDRWGGYAWYKQLQKLGIHIWGYVVIAGMLILTGSYFREMTHVEKSLFSVGILTKALANSTWFIFALANRSNIIAGVFVLSVVLLMWQRGYFYQKTLKVKLQKRWLGFSLLLFMNLLIFKVANLLEWTSFFVFVAPFIPWIDPDWNITVRQAIGKFL